MADPGVSDAGELLSSKEPKEPFGSSPLPMINIVVCVVVLLVSISKESLSDVFKTQSVGI